MAIVMNYENYGSYIIIGIYRNFIVLEWLKLSTSIVFNSP